MRMTMTRLLLFRLLLIVVLCGTTITVAVEDASSATTAASTSTTTSSSTTTTTTSSSSCGLYVAPSSTQTPHHNDDDADTTWGLYAGHEIHTGQVIGYPEVAVPLWNLKAHAMPREDDDDEDDDDDGADDNPLEPDLVNAMVALVEAYIWVPGPVGLRFAQPPGERIVAAVPGPGVLAAYNHKLTNANWWHHPAYSYPTEKDDTNVLDTSTATTTTTPHPGRGATSSYQAATIYATADIAAGSEIFMDYGDNWMEQHRDEALVLEDYKNLDATIDKMIAFFQKHHDLHEASKKQIYHFLTRDVLHAAVGPYKAHTMAALLPSSPDQLPEIPAKGGILVHSAPTIYRQVDWLETNGFCVDHVQPGPSTLGPHVGRGALATRTLPAGTVVTASPLVHIPDHRLLELHPLEVVPDDEWDEEDDEEEDDGRTHYRRVNNTVTGHQLLLNYCYGHPESSMVFFPAGPLAGLINHAPTTPRGPSSSTTTTTMPTANVKLQWSTNPRHENEWYELDPYELARNGDHHYLGLIMEVVATRDIEAGEEILLDYGADWEAAWEAHTTAWSATYPPTDDPHTWPLRAADYRSMYQHQPLPTMADLGHDPVYPPQVQLKAFLMIEESLRAGTRQDPKHWAMPDEGTAYDADHLFDLVVEDKRVVETHQNDGDADSTSEPTTTYEYLVRWTNNRGVDTFVDRVPADALVFVDAPGAADEFSTERPFRHWIGIPDDVFPAGPWRNLV